MFRIDVDDEPAGGIGWWQVDHDGVPAYETGWNVFPEWQGKGVAGSSAASAHPPSGGRGRPRDLLVAYPGVTNAPSNALCRRAGFEHTGSATAPWRGGQLTFNIWVLDMSPLDLAGREPDHDERFDAGELDRRAGGRTTRRTGRRARRSAARWETGPHGLTLRIDADTPPWSPRVRRRRCASSHLQTGQFSGPRGQRDRPAPLPRRAGRARGAARAAAVAAAVRRHRGADAGDPASATRWSRSGRSASRTEPEDSGEICVCEIFGSELDDSGRLGRRRRQAAARPAADARLREGPRRGRPDRVPRLRRRVGPGAHPVLHRRPMGQDGRAAHRLPGAAHARRLRAAERIGARDAAACRCGSTWNGSAPSAGRNGWIAWARTLPACAEADRAAA